MAMMADMVAGDWHEQRGASPHTFSPTLLALAGDAGACRPLRIVNRYKVSQGDDRQRPPKGAQGSGGTVPLPATRVRRPRGCPSHPPTQVTFSVRASRCMCVASQCMGDLPTVNVWFGRASVCGKRIRSTRGALRAMGGNGATGVLGRRKQGGDQGGRGRRRAGWQMLRNEGSGGGSVQGRTRVDEGVRWGVMPAEWASGTGGGRRGVGAGGWGGCVGVCGCVWGGVWVGGGGGGGGGGCRTGEQAGGRSRDRQREQQGKA